jgi:predicted nucleic acid-binding protein
VILLDTNLLLRYASAVDPAYPIASAAISTLTKRGRTLRIVPQNLFEFWVVATRPIQVNGLGLSPNECVSTIARIKRLFPLLPDQPALTAEWESLAAKHQCRGKTAHDARLVAAMRTHGLTEPLTFNGDDFRRYDGVTVLDPNAP